MRVPRVPSVHAELIVAGFLVHTSVPSAELCLEDTVANTKGKRKKGGAPNQKSPTSGPNGYITPADSMGSQHIAYHELTAPNPNSSGRATKRALRVPNPNSRGHTTKRALRVHSPKSRGHATKRAL